MISQQNDPCMDLYTLVHYLHVLGAIGLGAVIVLEWFALVRLRVAHGLPEQRAWLSFTALQQWLGPASVALLLLAGLYMAATRWGGLPWILVALLALGLIMALGAFNGVPLRRLQTRLQTEGGELTSRLDNPMWLVSVQVRAGIVLGVVLLMVLKPDLGPSLLILLAGIVLGAGSSAPVFLGTARSGPIHQSGASRPE
jgi:hypothetical protein